MKIILLATAICLSGCSGHDSKIRGERFDACMSKISKPAFGSSVDWASTINSCDSAAYSQSSCKKGQSSTCI